MPLTDSCIGVDYPEHPDLAGPGTWESQRTGFIIGLFGGFIFGSVYSAVKGKMCNLPQREIIRASIAHGRTTAYGASMFLFLAPMFSPFGDITYYKR